MSPTAVLTDFERATIQAIELAFPTTEVKECCLPLGSIVATISAHIADVRQ